MTADFRALCADLTNKLDELNRKFRVPNQTALVGRALAALAQPVADPGEVAELVEFLTPTRAQAGAISLEAFIKLRRAATLLQQLSASAPAVAPLKERPDFIAGYRAGLVDGRFLAAEEQAQRRDAHVSSFPLPQAGEVEG